MPSPGGPCNLRVIARLASQLIPRDDVHGWGHVQRVLAYANIIVEREGLEGRIDRAVLEACILLHDVGRFLEGEGHHAVKSARFARELLRALNCEERIVEKVTNCILAHSYSLGVKPNSLEAMVVSDADKLDAIGAIGVYRVVWESGRRGRSIEETIAHYRSKLSRLIDMLYLQSSREIAKELHNRIVTFFHQLENEVMNLRRYLRS